MANAKSPRGTAGFDCDDTFFVLHLEHPVELYPNLASIIAQIPGALIPSGLPDFLLSYNVHSLHPQDQLVILPCYRK